MPDGLAVTRAQPHDQPASTSSAISSARGSGTPRRATARSGNRLVSSRAVPVHVDAAAGDVASQVPGRETGRQVKARTCSGASPSMKAIGPTVSPKFVKRPVRAPATTRIGRRRHLEAGVGPQRLGGHHGDRLAVRFSGPLGDVLGQVLAVAGDANLADAPWGSPSSARKRRSASRSCRPPGRAAAVPRLPSATIAPGGHLAWSAAPGARP